MAGSQGKVFQAEGTEGMSEDFEKTGQCDLREESQVRQGLGAALRILGFILRAFSGGGGETTGSPLALPGQGSCEILQVACSDPPPPVTPTQG